MFAIEIKIFDQQKVCLIISLAKPDPSIARVWSQAYIAICTRCRNIAVQSDCRTCNYNILTSGENSRLCYLRGFVKRGVVANIQKVFEKQSELDRGRNWTTTTRSLNYYLLHNYVIIACLPYKTQYWLATRLLNHLIGRKCLLGIIDCSVLVV